MKRFLSCYRSYGRLLAVVVIGSVLSAVLETLFPMVVRHILDVVLPSGDLEALIRSALGLLGLYVLCLLLTFLVYYCGRNMGARIEHDLRCDLFSHVEGLSFSFFDRVHTGRLVSTVISDISEIGDLVFQLPNLALVCTITMAGSAFFMFRLNWQLAGLVLVVLALKTADTIWLNRRMKKTFFRAREKWGASVRSVPKASVPSGSFRPLAVKTASSAILKGPAKSCGRPKRGPISWKPI